jgi:hypothetical protein
MSGPASRVRRLLPGHGRDTGSGVLARATYRCRRGRPIEIDPAYVDVAIRRWQTYTGKTAALLATGETFEEVEETRLPVPSAQDAGTVREAA